MSSAKRTRVLDYVEPIGKVLQLKKGADEKDTYGVEIENEFKYASFSDFRAPKHWKLVEDHSLRYCGVEFVSIPQEKRALYQSLDNLEKYIGSKNDTPLNSIRTSVHVHTNVAWMNFQQIVTFACTYWLLEDFLSEFTGKTRKGNLFCLRLKDADVVSDLIEDALKRKSFLVGSPIFSDQYRYASVNFAAIKKFGTLEFRLLRGTFDCDAIKSWTNAIAAIKEFSLRFSNLGELRDYFLYDVDASSFPKRVLGDTLYKTFKKCNTEPDAVLVRKGYESVENLFYCTDNFDFLAVAKREEEERRKRLLNYNRAILSTSYDEFEDFAIFYEDSVFENSYGEDI